MSGGAAALPPLVHLVKLDSWGGVERLFEGFWRRQAAPRRVFNLDARVHPLFQPLFGAGECLPYKQVNGLRLPRWPRALRAHYFHRRVAPAAAPTLALMWNVLGFAVPRRSGARVRFIHYEHGAVWKGERKRHVRNYLRDIDGIVCCAQANAEMFRRYWDWRGPLDVCLNGLLPQYRIAAQPRQLDARRRLRVGAVARLSHEKGLALLLHAVAELRRGGVDAELHLAGDGPARGDLTRLAQNLAIDCTFHGLLADVGPFLDQVDVVGCPSLYESFPLACVEAHAHALPVVGANIGGIGEVVEPGVTGEVVAPKHALADYPRFGGSPHKLEPWLTWLPATREISALKLADPAELAAAIRSIAGDPARYAAMSAAALARATERFSFDAYFARMTQSLARLAA